MHPKLDERQTSRGGWIAALVLATLCAVPVHADEPADLISFNVSIRPLLNQHCVACHGGVKQAADLTFVYREAALNVIEPGRPEDSYLVERITAESEDERMPPAEHGPRLAAEDIALIMAWIRQGAKWEEHWAYVPPRAMAPSQKIDSDWIKQPLDAAVLAKLKAEGLTPSQEAERVTWLRRTSLDLIGLPPTPHEIQSFIHDQNPGAYERVVDRLLESERYGERWASMWLDLARYADTKGFEKDTQRTVWPFRDWLIRSLNDDLPYDQFTVRLLAGDLLPDATMDDFVATTFHRNTQTNTEGGTDDEEYRIAAVIDRVNTTWQVWQATTFGCVQCHSHPYAPFRHAEYYRFLAFFNTSRDHDRDDETPVLQLPLDPSQYERALQLDRERRDLQRAIHHRVWGQFAQSKWQGLVPDAAHATGETRLEIALSDHDAVTEVRASGTIAQGVRYTVEIPAAELPRTVTALRIDVLPVDTEAARRTPERGFAISELTASVADGEHAVPVPLTMAYCDEPTPLLNPEDSFKKGGTGWGDYPRLWKMRTAVFLPAKPLVIAAGTRIRLEIGQQMAATGNLPMVIRRARFTATDDPGWTSLAADPGLQSDRERVALLAAERQTIKSLPLPVMDELDDALKRESYVFDGGNWLEKADLVTAAVPELFPTLPAHAVANRLAMARWLVSPENPLTARVMVNRLWEQLFGIGLVETVEDFGPVGATPSHPRLLDDLAVRFQTDYTWSVKRLLREIVLSATYRQHSKVSPELLHRDPRNRLLARGPRIRLTAEMMRDQALSVSGLISEKMYGPPVMPPQPDGVWRSVYNGSQWKTSAGDDRYRRAVYTYWKRTSAYPSMITFDAPSREVCSMRRLTTNTPLQALVLLNDPVYVECANALAGKMLEGNAEPGAGIRRGFRLASGREPDDATVYDLHTLYDAAIDEYAKDPAAAKKFASSSERYAMAAVANAILNLDLILTK